MFQRFSQLTACALLLVCAILIPDKAISEIKLAKLPNWSPTSLAQPKGLFIRPADSISRTLSASWNNYKVIVTQPGDSTPIFKHVFDNEVDSLHSVVLGDFDSDGKIEIAMLVFDFRNYARPLPWEFFSTDTVELHLTVQEINYPENADSTVYIIERAWSFVNLYGFPFPNLLSSGDFNSDGHENLAFSVGWLEDHSVAGFPVENSAGFTNIWNKFPNQLETKILFPVSFLEENYDGHSFFEAYRYAYDELQSPNLTVQNSRLNIYEQLHSYHTFPNEFSTCIENDLNDNILSQSLLVAGVSLIDTNRSGALIHQSGISNCEYLNYVEMFAFDDTLGMTSLWQSSDFNFTTFVYHPQRPKRFMAIQGTTMYEFNSATGEVIDSTTEPLPSGIQGWYDLFGDGNKYLVTLNDTLLEAYGFDFVTDVADDDDIALLPESFTLSEPYPNPFNPSVSFSIVTNGKTEVTINIYNILGQKVSELFSGTLSAGESTFSWNAVEYSSGLYFIHATTKNGLAETRKAVLLK